MYTVLKLFWPFEGNHKADVTPGENEFDTLAQLNGGLFFSIVRTLELSDPKADMAAP